MQIQDVAHRLREVVSDLHLCYSNETKILGWSWMQTLIGASTNVITRMVRMVGSLENHVLEIVVGTEAALRAIAKYEKGSLPRGRNELTKQLRRSDLDQWKRSTQMKEGHCDFPSVNGKAAPQLQRGECFVVSKGFIYRLDGHLLQILWERSRSVMSLRTPRFYFAT